MIETKLVFKMNPTMLLVMVVLSWSLSYSAITKTVGVGKEYPDIESAMASVPNPLVEDVSIVVDLSLNGYSEIDLDINIDDFDLGPFEIEIIPNDLVMKDETHYVGEVREYRKMAEGGISETILKYGSIGRKVIDAEGVESEFEFFVKNRLASLFTTLNASGGRIGDLYEYYPYGKQKVSIAAASPVTESFTSKEFDIIDEDQSVEGEGHYYFGARYYDPDIGLWLSTDPMRQFHSGYSYGDPINAIDPDGRLKETINPSTGEITYTEFPILEVTKQVEHPIAGPIEDPTMFDQIKFSFELADYVDHMKSSQGTVIPDFGPELALVGPLASATRLRLGPHSRAGGLSLGYTAKNGKQLWRLDYGKLPSAGKRALKIPANLRGRNMIHWHNRRPGGIGRHRPWESAPADKTFFNRL